MLQEMRGVPKWTPQTLPVRIHFNASLWVARREVKLRALPNVERGARSEAFRQQSPSETRGARKKEFEEYHSKLWLGTCAGYLGL